MYLAWIVCVLTTQVTLVTSHGGHVEDPGAKTSSLSNALLSYLCRGGNGVLCNGHGSCKRGLCLCSKGYSGVKCDLADEAPDTVPGGVGDSPVDTGNEMSDVNIHDLLGIHTSNQSRPVSCEETDDRPCEGHGLCHDGACACDEGYSGLTCELSPNIGFCHAYKECAECTALMSECPEKCTKMANFKHVFGFPVATAGSHSFRKCRFRNSERNCTFYFKEDGQDDRGMTIIKVKACLAYQGAAVGTSNAVEQLTDRPVSPDMTEEVTLKPEDGTQDKQDGGRGSGQAILTVNLLTLVSSLALLKL